MTNQIVSSNAMWVILLIMIITDFGEGEHAGSLFQIMEKPYYFWCLKNQLQSAY